MLNSIKFHSVKRLASGDLYCFDDPRTVSGKRLVLHRDNGMWVFAPPAQYEHDVGEQFPRRSPELVPDGGAPADCRPKLELPAPMPRILPGHRSMDRFVVVTLIDLTRDVYFPDEPRRLPLTYELYDVRREKYISN